MAGNTLSSARCCHSTLLVGAFLACFILGGCSRQEEVAGISQETSAVPTTGEVLERSARALGSGGISRIEIKGNGWEACLGQPWKISDGWARWSITDYTRVTDYSTFNSFQTAVRQAGMDPDKLGGCGAQPNAAPQNQQSSVNPGSAWEQRLQVYLTPMGFLQLAQEYGGRVEEVADGLNVVVDTVVVDGAAYRVVGSFGDDYLPDRITTWIDNPVFGDMPFEAEFSAYRDFAGLMFPTRIIQKQGGYPTLDLAIDEVIPGTQASAEPPPREARPAGGGGQQDPGPAYEQIGEGIYALAGAYQSVLMVFADFTVVLDGLQSDQRAKDIIRLARQIAPDKPVGYVLSTHNHFDHASGLREFVAQGATILTHESNVDFFEQALSVPRTLAPGETAGNGMPVKVQGIGDFYAIDDGTRRVEFYKLDNSLHADDMLIAWIPAIKTIVEADLLQPWISPVFGGKDHPFLIWLADELDRVGLDYEQFVPVHRPPNPPLMTRADLMTAVGR